VDDLDGDLVLLGRADARLVLHVLDTFERLLRYGHLSDAQLELLTGDDTGRPEASADLLMANIVSEAATPVRRQLD
jgi:hypothetical protein